MRGADVSHDQFPLLHALVASMGDGAGVRTGAELIEQVIVETPFEATFDSLDAGFAASTPTQSIRTGVMPVWHRLQVTFTVDESTHTVQPPSEVQST